MERLFIGGEYIASTSAVATAVENPATEETSPRFPMPTPPTSTAPSRQPGEPSGNGGWSTAWSA